MFASANGLGVSISEFFSSIFEDMLQELLSMVRVSHLYCLAESDLGTSLEIPVSKSPLKKAPPGTA